MGQHRAAGELMQDLRPARAHAHPFARGEHDGETAAGVEAHRTFALSPIARWARKLGPSESPPVALTAVSPRRRAVSSRKADSRGPVPRAAGKSGSLRRKKR